MQSVCGKVALLAVGVAVPFTGLPVHSVTVLFKAESGPVTGTQTVAGPLFSGTVIGIGTTTGGCIT